MTGAVEIADQILLREVIRENRARLPEQHRRRETRSGAQEQPKRGPALAGRNREEIGLAASAEIAEQPSGLIVANLRVAAARRERARRTSPVRRTTPQRRGFGRSGLSPKCSCPARRRAGGFARSAGPVADRISDQAGLDVRITLRVDDVPGPQHRLREAALTLVGGRTARRR